MLWKHWWELVCELRSACARTRTFLWMAVCLAGMTTRKDLMGVTSIVRALGLMPACYDRLPDFFHSPALDLNKLTRLWCDPVFRVHPGIVRVNGRPVLIGDGIKVAKAGRKMPGVKKLHQQSESNTKPKYIFGHSCQAIAILTQALSSIFAIPLTCRIHEGVVFSNRDKRTLLDKMILLIDALGIRDPFYFVADAYYASGKIVRGLLAQGNHLVTRVKRNSVAYYPAPPVGLVPAAAKSATPQGTPQEVRQKDQGRLLAEEPRPNSGGSQPRLWRGGSDDPVQDRRPVVAPRRDPRPLRGRGPSASRYDPTDEYGPESDARGHHPNLRAAFQDRTLLQAITPCHRGVCLSLLDGCHEAVATRQR